MLCHWCFMEAVFVSIFVIPTDLYKNIRMSETSCTHRSVHFNQPSGWCGLLHCWPGLIISDEDSVGLHWTSYPLGQWLYYMG